MRNEIGLSEGYVRALGEYIGRRAADIGGNACGVMLVTHSRPLAAGLLEGFGTSPTMIAMRSDDDPSIDSVADWIATPQRRSVDDLLSLRDAAHRRFRAVQGILRRRA